MHRAVYTLARQVSLLQYFPGLELSEVCSVSAQSIEDALSISPRDECTLFANRDKFDLVAMYDDSSESLGDQGSPLHSLSRAIYEQSFRKFLKIGRAHV